MISIPLPFVIALLLIVLLAEVIRRDDGLRAGGAPMNAPFLALIGVSILQSALLGLRWGYGVQAVMYVMPVAAALVPPLAYAGVARLVWARAPAILSQLVLHLLPAALVLALMLLWRNALDIVLALISIAYAGAILLLMRPGADALRQMPFENTIPTFRSVILSAFALLLFAALDLYVSFDFAEGRGSHAVAMITIGNLALLFILSSAAAIASRSRTTADLPALALPGVEDGDRETMEKITRLMAERHAYRDAELTLERLARKVLIPARQISGAINRGTGKNVSQYVNEYRIREACQLLAASEKSVTEIMFDVGFQTKSNFNREFRRVTDMTPVEWRGKHRPAPA
jgi:AraC-like DNA-binding protein